MQDYGFSGARNRFASSSRVSMILIRQRPAIHLVVHQHVEDAVTLRSTRSVLVRAPHVKLHLLRRLDDRSAAHLDGLAETGDFGRGLCLTALETVSGNSVFAATVVAIEARDVALLEKLMAIAEADSSARTGLVSALGWVSAAALRGITRVLLQSASGFRLDIGLAACAMHQVDPGAVLAAAIAETSRSSRAVVVAGKLGRVDLLPDCVAALAQGEGEHCFEAARVSLLLGDRQGAVAKLAEFARVVGNHQAVALTLLLKVLSTAHANVILKALSQETTMVRVLIRGIGAAGDPHYVPWLIAQMSDLKLTRLAGESFSLITGLDLAALDLERKPPENEDFGPNGDPGDYDVAMDEDDSLPWPDPDKIGAWWQANGQRFTSGTRYFMGAPPSPAHCLSVLKTGFQRQRIAAAHYLSLLTPGTPLFNTAAPAWRQQRLLTRMGA